MKKVFLLVAVLSLVPLVSSFATPPAGMSELTAAGVSGAAGHISIHRSRDPVIWDNMASGYGGSLISSQIDSVNPFDSQAADDFKIRDQIPVGTPEYLITGIEWIGGYWSGEEPPPPPPPPPLEQDFIILFYADSDGKPTGGPGDPSQTALATYVMAWAEVNETENGDGTYSYSASLQIPFAVNYSSTYWVAIQSVNDFPPQWGISDSVDFYGSPFRQGFPELGISYWDQIGTSDLAFRLIGVPGSTCRYDDDCDDDLFCNGPESCIEEECHPGEAPCTIEEICDEDTDTCVPLPEVYILELEASYAESMLSLDFTLGATTPTVWATYLILTSPSPQIIPLWVSSIPEVDPPIEIPISFPFPTLELIGIGSTLLTAEGSQASVLEWIVAAEPAPGTKTELAGRTLGEYPFFEYVKATNEDEPVEVAIDPTRFPEITGQTCDLYVVEAKTAAGWSLDASLTDVRPWGHQTKTFVGTTIQDNTFQVSTADMLDSAAGTGLGVGYDVIFDCDQDGLLGEADYGDGIGDESGFYVVHDTATMGPLATASTQYSVSGVTAGFTWERTWYPADIATMGRLPLIVVSHGNGHQYTWYDYLQQHLASYGYIVMSHQNNTVPGIETCSTTTLEHTDAIIEQQVTIGGGVLSGHIDSDRIVWIGHSRGAEGVARAFDRIYDGTWTPEYYGLDDIVLISSIAPTDFLGTSSSTPHEANHHLLYGSADGDVGGYPSSDIADSFNVYERAEAFRQSTYVHGADHNDFNCCGFDDFDGPPGTAIGRTEAQQVAKGIYLPLIKHYVEGNVPATDFFWRQYESFRPIGVDSATTVVSEYKTGTAAGKFIIDDYQDRQAILGASSSGAPVTYSVQSLYEGLMNDSDGIFTFSGIDPMNGMTRARTSDITWGAVFDWSSVAYMEYEVNQSGRDWSDHLFLSFRACQQTRHPLTTAELDDLTFTVTLRDAGGSTSSINFGVFGGGIEEPYQRTGDGDGAGWQNEFETVRIRLTDFQNNGSGLDLTNVEALRFLFGSIFGSAQGRIGVDDVEVTNY